MAFPLVNGGRIRTNSPAENAFNALNNANADIANRQLRLSTGKRINSAADDVAGYITSRSLMSRVGSLRSASNAIGDAKNTVVIAQEALDNITGLLSQIKDSASTAASGALATDEKVSLAKAAYRLTEQIQTVVDSTVFGGNTLLSGAFSGDFVIGFNADNSLITLGIDLTTATGGAGSTSNGFMVDVNALSASEFAGVTGLTLGSLNSVSDTDLGIFSRDQIAATIGSLSTAVDNVTKLGSYLGGLVNRLDSQESNINSQITNYNAAISRIEDADYAQEQLQLVRAQFLQQTSVISLTQANQNPQTFLQLLG